MRTPVIVKGPHGAVEISRPREPVRVGLLVNSFMQPHWVYKIITDIQRSSIAQVVLIVKLENFNGKQEKSISRILRKTNYILYMTYMALDNYISRVNPNALKEMNIEKCISDCPVIQVRRLTCEDITAIHEYALDIALDFSFQKIRGDIVHIAKYGVWAYDDECSPLSHRVPSGFWEVMRGQPVTESTLRVLEESGNGKVLCRSYVATNRFSVKRNRNGFLWNSSSFVLRKINGIYENGSLQLDDEVLDSSSDMSNPSMQAKPTNFHIFPYLINILGKYCVFYIQNIFCYDQWFIAYKIEDKETYIGDVPHGFKALVSPKGTFWADPFPVKYNDRYFIFTEEYVYKNKKGHITVIEMNENLDYKNSTKVLEKDHHLSYPFIFQWCGDYYMIPETAHARSIELYRCAAFPFDWKLEKILLSDIKAVDTTLAEINGLWWMFVNVGIDGTSNDVDLYLFYANTPMGPWKPHKRNPVKSDVRSARSAGRIFFWQGEMYRPSQDCSEGYGHAIAINKIICIDTDRYIEAEVSKILPQWSSNVVANHTLNSCENLTVIDGMMKTFKGTIPGVSKRNNMY